ncbi:MAG TPA: phospholipase D-like domain-containing protein [Geobacteraceae bacterium]
MDHLLWTILIAATAASSLGSAGHALIWKRDPRSALGWITICLTLPLAGPLLYWSMGVNRIRRTAQQWYETGRRLEGREAFSVRQLPAPPDLPAHVVHLKELRALADRVASTQLVPGNRITPLRNGEQAYPAMLSAIDGAKHSINLSTYIFDSDEVGRRFVAALRAAAERGVEVRVIIDCLGEKYTYPFARRLFRGSRVKVGGFLPLRQGIYVNLRNHRKVMVVDGEKGFTGGMNIGRRHLVERTPPPPLVKDLHFAVTGPAVADLQRVFLEDWHFVTGELANDDRFFPPPCPGRGRTGTGYQ